MVRNSGSGWRRALTITLLSLASAFCAQAPAKGISSDHATTADTTIAAAQLPSQGQKVLALIYEGGPFRHDKDGTVFGNREKLLPLHPRGYYREYTVRTPGVSHRGARRIVCGGHKPTRPDACYYTEDHYASFRRIVH